MILRTLCLCGLAVAGASACASSALSSDYTRRSVSKSETRKASGFQIQQCYSVGAPRVGISYPPGWSRRVSRAETEDELLGGTNKALSEATAFAKPVGGTVPFVYPQAALSPPVEGICEVKFDLSRNGKPSNIVSACSSKVFVEAATEAVAASRFHPVRLNGSAAKAVNMTYDMKFCLAD